jgi:hypothetical protein
VQVLHPVYGRQMMEWREKEREKEREGKRERERERERERRKERERKRGTGRAGERDRVGGREREKESVVKALSDDVQSLTNSGMGKRGQSRMFFPRTVKDTSGGGILHA